jgi:hypothetical protein
MSEGWNMVHVTSPEGWRQVKVRDESGNVHLYTETAEVDEQGRAVYEYVGPA